jgi:hypothetical protein
MKEIISRFLAVIASICILACGGCASNGNTLKSQNAPVTAPQKTERDSKRYYFEHRLLPSWTLDGNGLFFADLRKGHKDRITTAAGDIVDAEYAKSIKTKNIDSFDAVIITLESPLIPPQCYSVIVAKTESGYRYFTLEFGRDITGIGIKAFVCEWAPGIRHVNLGPVKYVDSENFIQEVGKLLRK